MTDGDVDLEDLSQLCTLSPALVGMWAEAAAVMLAKFHPAPPPKTRMTVAWDAERCALHLQWTAPDARALDSHANDKDATEHAAYAIAVAAAHHCGYVVRRRAVHGSGADLIMVRRGDINAEFVKVEVSGIAREGRLAARVHQKLAQVEAGVAVVVHFEAATIVARSA